MSVDDSAEVSSPTVWFKSSYSSNEGGACVEVAAAEVAVFVRDSKDTSRPGLTVAHAGWARFVRYAAGV